MLTRTSLLERDGVALWDVTCRHGQGPGEDVERVGAHMLILVRRGCFVRASDADEAVLDPTLGYCANPGEEQRIDHPHHGGDECTALVFEPELLAQIWGGDPGLPREPVRISPDLDIEHRRLLAGARRGAQREELAERTIMLAAGLLGRVDRRRVDAGRRATVRRRGALVAGVRERLASEPDQDLRRLAHELAVSPHHLSRIFHAETGHTIARHRMRLRARAALERLAGRERELARLAAELGFADQSHLSRVLRSETGETPGSLRHELTA